MEPLKTIAPFWYTPESEAEAEKPTRFKLKPLQPDIIDDVLFGALTTEAGDLQLRGKGIATALKHGLVEWENFGDLKCKWTNFNKIPWTMRNVLASEIINCSDLNGDDEKN